MQDFRKKMIYDFMEEYDLSDFKISRQRLKTNYVLDRPDECILSSTEFNKHIHLYSKTKGIRCGEIMFKGKISFHFTNTF